MPVLEAIACSLPSSAHAAGRRMISPPTILPCESSPCACRLKSNPGVMGMELEIDFDHLVHQMMTVVESAAFTAQASVKGPAFATANFTWRHVAILQGTGLGSHILAETEGKP